MHFDQIDPLCCSEKHINTKRTSGEKRENTDFVIYKYEAALDQLTHTGYFVGIWLIKYFKLFFIAC
jgi:hypothetical protein